MRAHIEEKFSQMHINRLLQAGYEWHCIQNDRLCLHRTLDTYWTFPRFHLFVSVFPDAFEISVHWDQYSLHHESNKHAQWAYEGRRVQEELHRVAGFLKGISDLKTVSHSNLGFVPKFIRRRDVSSKVTQQKRTESKRPWNWRPIIRT